MRISRRQRPRIPVPASRAAGAFTRLGLALVAGGVLIGCSAGASAWQLQPVASPPNGELTAVAGARTEAISVEVHRAPGCGCCHGWEAYLEAHGYRVSAADDPDIASFKAAHGVPASAQSCHTALIAGYVIEGHVPVAAIEDLLAGRPDIDGIALPGMPPGSPGMSGELEGPLEVLALAKGQTSPFGSY